MVEPRLEVLPHNEYVNQVWHRIGPDDRPWWMTLAYRLNLTHQLYPRAFIKNGVVYVEDGYDTPKRLAHEWAHAQPNSKLPSALHGEDGTGDHPKGLRNLIDVAGVSPLRFTDKWNLVKRSTAWRIEARAQN